MIRPSTWGPLLATAAALLCSSVCVEPASACSICLAGDPVFDATGTSVGEVGQWNLFIQGSGWEKTSGALPHHAPGDEHEEHPATEENTSQRLDLSLGWTPIDRLTLTLNVPFAFNHIKEIEEGVHEHFSLSGLGDVSLLGSVVLWRNRDVLPGTWVEGRAFLKTPTGKSHERVGGVKDPHLQPGTGSWDFGGGLAAAHQLPLGSLYASASYRVNTEGSLDYEYGDSALANAAVLVPLPSATGVPWLAPFTAGAELNYRWAGRDEFHGQNYKDSGGSILYATPSLRIALAALAIGERLPPSLRFSLQVPLTNRWLHGQQEERLLWRAGLLVPF
ncbi:MAG: hypothetical protein E4H11_10420 [Myxococcales bacterium]|nr:MAG: hypothetical protein E4H11_10420 [Myxococcales bacterium]